MVNQQRGSCFAFTLKRIFGVLITEFMHNFLSCAVANQSNKKAAICMTFLTGKKLFNLQLKKCQKV